MNEAQAEEVILQHWATGWEALHPTIPISYGDETFTAVAAFVRVTIVSSDRFNQAIGGGRLANIGNIAVQIMTPPNSGTQLANQLADSARAVLENVTIASPLPDDEPVCVYAGSSRNGAPSNDGAWKVKMVVFEYRWDEI